MSDAGFPDDLPEDRDEDVALAAEYVLGLLEPAELRAFEARLAVDPGLRELVARWSEDLVTLAESARPVAPPARVEAALMAELFPRERRSWLARLGWLPLVLGGAVAALLLLWIAAPGLLTRPPQGPAFVAEVAAEDRSLVVAARFEPGEGEIVVEREAGAAPPGRVLELWIIPEGGAPVSLGVLPEAEAAELAVPEAFREGFPAGILAISEEPPGGAPGAAPTGAVLATGPITTL
jgi:anti-sigma-K factor RskA